MLQVSSAQPAVSSLQLYVLLETSAVQYCFAHDSRKVATFQSLIAARVALQQLFRAAHMMCELRVIDLPILHIHTVVHAEIKGPLTCGIYEMSCLY